jgi:hypothetical protein
MRKWIIGVLVIALAGGIYWRLRAKPRPIGEAYVGEQNAIVWNTTAQVRQTIATLHWGDQVAVLSHSGNQSRVRTATGLEGWMDARMLLDDAAWAAETKLLAQARTMIVQAPGRTKVVTNVRLEPGRDATRVYQLPGSVPVVILARKTADISPPTGASAATTEKSEATKREDWLLISAPAATADAAAGSQTGESAQEAQAQLVTGNDAQNTPGTTRPQHVPPLAGWVTGRFIELDLPETLRDYASSSDLRPVAWFVLNRVPSASGEKAQYLVAGTHGPEGQPCDFTMLRVYTWGAMKGRYETAFVENDLCGSFPIDVGKQAKTGDPEFQFKGMTVKEPLEQRVYVMHQTVVRRERQGEPAARRSVAR